MTEVFYGTVKFYNNARDFGFVTRDDNAGAGDVFIGAEGRRIGLHAGDQVSFELELGRDKRQRAVNVQVRRAAAPDIAGEARGVGLWVHDGRD